MSRKRQFKNRLLDFADEIVQKPMDLYYLGMTAAYVRMNIKEEGLQIEDQACELHIGSLIILATENLSICQMYQKLQGELLCLNNIADD